MVVGLMLLSWVLVLLFCFAVVDLQLGVFYVCLGVVLGFGVVVVG